METSNRFFEWSLIDIETYKMINANTPSGFHTAQESCLYFVSVYDASSRK